MPKISKERIRQRKEGVKVEQDTLEIVAVLNILSEILFRLRTHLIEVQEQKQIVGRGISQIPILEKKIKKRLAKDLKDGLKRNK